MSEHIITVNGGTSVRLLTAGKYCDKENGQKQKHRPKKFPNKIQNGASP